MLLLYAAEMNWSVDSKLRLEQKTTRWSKLSWHSIAWVLLTARMSHSEIARNYLFAFFDGLDCEQYVGFCLFLLRTDRSPWSIESLPYWCLLEHSCYSSFIHSSNAAQSNDSICSLYLCCFTTTAGNGIYLRLLPYCNLFAAQSFKLF